MEKTKGWIFPRFYTRLGLNVDFLDLPESDSEECAAVSQSVLPKKEQMSVHLLLSLKSRLRMA